MFNVCVFKHVCVCLKCVRVHHQPTLMQLRSSESRSSLLVLRTASASAKLGQAVAAARYWEQAFIHCVCFVCV